MMWYGLFDGGAQLELNKELLSHYWCMTDIELHFQRFGHPNCD